VMNLYKTSLHDKVAFELLESLFHIWLLTR
jgi:hypothetical protein